MKAAIYARISADRSGTAAGVRRQEEDCRELAEKRGWEVTGVFRDNDISAYSGRRRPAYEEMMEGVRSGQYGAIIAWHADRLHRSPLELEAFIDQINEAGTKVATVQAGEYDLATASGRMTARVVGAVARHESEQKGERIRRKAAELAREGRATGGGTRPFGFESDRVSIRVDEADLIREAARRILSGESLRGIVRDWHDRGIRTPTDRHWKQTPLRRMLLSPRIAGMREHRGRVVAEAEWSAIIDEQTHRRLKAVLNDRSRRKFDPSKARRYLLTGIAKCGLCGEKLVARPRGDKTRTYVCASGVDFGGCGKIRAVAEPLEDFVSEAVLVALDSPEVGAAISASGDEEVDGLLAELEELERSMEQLAKDHYADRVITREEFLSAREAIADRIETLRSTVSAGATDLGSGVAVTDEVAAAWETGDLEWRRRLLAAVLSAVVVQPVRVRGRNWFDPARVELAWKL